MAQVKLGLNSFQGDLKQTSGTLPKAAFAIAFFN